MLRTKDMADIPRAIKAMAMLISVRMFDLTQDLYLFFLILHFFWLMASMVLGETSGRVGSCLSTLESLFGKGVHLESFIVHSCSLSLSIVKAIIWL